MVYIEEWMIENELGNFVRMPNPITPNQDGIFLNQITEPWEDVVKELIKEHNYAYVDVVKIDPSIVDMWKFWDEHRHSEDEIRIIIEGDCRFYIRGIDNRHGWWSIKAYPNALIKIPSGRYHRFTIESDKPVTAVRLFKQKNGWQAEYKQLYLF